MTNRRKHPGKSYVSGFIRQELGRHQNDHKGFQGVERGYGDTRSFTQDTTSIGASQVSRPGGPDVGVIEDFPDNQCKGDGAKQIRDGIDQ